MKPLVYRVDPSSEYFFEEGCHILELLNRPDDAGLSVARARVAPGQRTRRHRLAKTTERYLILQGEGRVSVGESLIEPVGPNSVVVIPPDTDQAIENTGSVDLVFLAICTPRFEPDCYAETEDH
jgi:mannose-6-phosphate isomerase-like protein (cupin superfamily)